MVVHSLHLKKSKFFDQSLSSKSRTHQRRSSQPTDFFVKPWEQRLLMVASVVTTVLTVPNLQAILISIERAGCFVGIIYGLQNFLLQLAYSSPFLAFALKFAIIIIPVAILLILTSYSLVKAVSFINSFNNKPSKKVFDEDKEALLNNFPKPQDIELKSQPEQPKEGLDAIYSRTPYEGLSKNGINVLNAMVTGYPNAYSNDFGPNKHFDWWLFPYELTSNRDEYTLSVSDYYYLLTSQAKKTELSESLVPISHLIEAYTCRMADNVTNGGMRPNQKENDMILKAHHARPVKMLYSIACLLHTAIENNRIDDIQHLSKAANNVLILTENSTSTYSRQNDNLSLGNRSDWNPTWNLCNGRALLCSLIQKAKAKLPVQN